MQRLRAAGALVLLAFAVGPVAYRAPAVEGTVESANVVPTELPIDRPLAAARVETVAAAPQLGPLADGETLVARARDHVSFLAVYDAPFGRALDLEWTVTNPTYFGSPLVLRILEGREDQPYVRALLPVRPNGTTGWVRSADFDFNIVRSRIEISVEYRTLRAFDGTHLIAETPIVVGRDSTPTPLGSFYVNERLEKPNRSGPYGPWILGVAAYSETLQAFDGGIPVIGLHGTNQPELIGQARSNGCVRMDNDVIETLARRLPLGTPVSIT